MLEDASCECPPSLGSRWRGIDTHSGACADLPVLSAVAGAETASGPRGVSIFIDPQRWSIHLLDCSVIRVLTYSYATIAK